MIPLGDLFLGDLVSAFARLRPADDDSRAAIGKMLCFSAKTESQTLDTKGENREDEKQPPDDNLISPEKPVTYPTPTSAPRPMEPQNAEKTRVVLSYQQPSPLPGELEKLSRFSMDDKWHVFTPFEANDALFTPIWQRQILIAMGGRFAPLGSVDTVPLIEKIARGEPVRTVPRHLRWSLLHGVQLLLDTGSSMLPYTYDQHQLLIAMKRLVGNALLDVWRFQNAPWQQVRPGPGKAWREYVPPPCGTPVLVISRIGTSCDEGMSDMLMTGWLHFAARLRSHGNPMVILTPYPEKQVFSALRATATVVHWDRSTTVRSVLNRRRRCSIPGGQGAHHE